MDLKRLTFTRATFPAVWSFRLEDVNEWFVADFALKLVITYNDRWSTFAAIKSQARMKLFSHTAFCQILSTPVSVIS